MGKVLVLEAEIISEQSKKEICYACMIMAKTLLNITDEQLKQFEKDFYFIW